MTTEFVFRKNDSIGEAAAEDEKEVLAECFVDTGDLAVLLNCRESKRIVVGRTGAGKSALIQTIARRADNVVQLSPHQLSLNFIANSNVIQFFEEAGVSLAPFYILLWKHILVVELLQAKYKIQTEDGQRQTMNRLREIFYRKDRIKEQAVEYLEEWGNKFWLTTEQRMSELTTKVESKLTGALGTSGFLIDASLDAAKSLSEEQRAEVVRIGRSAVSQVQIRELENMITILEDEVFSDEQEVYYLTIDELDEEWVDTRIKYRLVKALLDTVRTFRRVERVKIVVALRQDLLEKVLRSSTDPGMQEEKYESLFLHLEWSKESLKTVLDRRIARLVRHRYTTKPVGLRDVLQNQVDGEDPLEYIFDRTFLRPRDAILFLNDCIGIADGRPSLTAAVIKAAEGTYSQKRLQSLAYEWQILYPNLKPIIQMFNSFNASFEVSYLTRDLLEERYTAAIGEIDQSKKDRNVDLIDSLYTPAGNYNSVRSYLLLNLYMVGVLGIKIGPSHPINWSTKSRVLVSASEIRPASTIHIHPTFYRALAIRDRQ
jgi:hypothetical protein